MKRLPSDCFLSSDKDASQVPRGTPPAWLTGRQLASSLQGPLEMIHVVSEMEMMGLIRRYSLL